MFMLLQMVLKIVDDTLRFMSYTNMATAMIKLGKFRVPSTDYSHVHRDERFIKLLQTISKSLCLSKISL